MCYSTGDVGFRFFSTDNFFFFWGGVMGDSTPPNLSNFVRDFFFFFNYHYESQNLSTVKDMEMSLFRRKGGF